MPIEVKNLNYIYMKGTPFEKHALKNISLKIEDGDFAAIIGHTGSGKSTLIQQLNGLLKPNSGTIVVNDVCITEPKVKLSDVRKKVGLVFQYPEYQLFEETVYKDVAYGLLNLGLSEDEIEKRVKRAMNMVGLNYDTQKDKSPFELSGGMKRRAAIAGVVAMEPNILILDEPIAGLDPYGREEIFNNIKILHKEYKMTIVLVSHSMEDVAKLCNKVIVMNEGEIVLTGEPKEIFKEVEFLEKIGLSVPQVVYLKRELENKGFKFTKDVITIDEMKEELINILNNKRVNSND